MFKVSKKMLGSKEKGVKNLFIERIHIKRRFHSEV